MSPVGFEPTIAAGDRPLTYALDGAVTGTGSLERQAFKTGYNFLWDTTLPFPSAVSHYTTLPLRCGTPQSRVYRPEIFIQASRFG
jgi:hypothetical protein